MVSENTLVPLSQAGQIAITGGRVTTFDPPASGRAGVAVESVSVTGLPEHGNLTVNPDNTLALVMTTTDYTGPLSFGFEVRYSDGTRTFRTAELAVKGGPQEAGWDTGEHLFALETDDDGRSIVEPGENHRKVYVSSSSDALSLNDIAAREGIPVTAVDDGEWLEKHPEYGGSEGMALDPEAGMALWYQLTSGRAEAKPSSHWLLLERGHEYPDLGRLVERGTTGESALHPIVIGAWGKGDKPVVHSTLNAYQEITRNLVVQDIEFDGGIQVLKSENVLFEGVTVTKEGMNIQKGEGFTIRASDFVDVIVDKAADKDFWAPSHNRVSGVFINTSNGVLMEDVFADHNGWADDYRHDLGLGGGQPPSFYSHNIYIQKENTDVTFRDNVTMRGASFGAQIRSGGFIEDNVFLDNNAGVNFLGGDDKGAGPVGNYTLFADNVVTSAGYKRVDQKEGALSMGVADGGELTSRTGNIIAHLADPGNPAEQALKEVTHDALKTIKTPYYDDTIIYNWVGSKHLKWFDEWNQNVAGLSEDKLDQTTIQNYAAELLGKPKATIADLADYLRDHAGSSAEGKTDADLIVSFFQQGFGLAEAGRNQAETLRFVPDDLGDGVRWDNRLNWSSDDLPGTVDGDSVDLAGNWVIHGGTVTLQDLDFGSGGALFVGQGYLEVADMVSVGARGADLAIARSGQFWIDGYADVDALAVEVMGGRFANTGAVTGAIDMEIAGGETLLAASGATFGLGAGHTLLIAGDTARVGFDGQGGDDAVLRLEAGSTLGFAPGSNGVAGIGEFRSGHWGLAAPDVRSVIELGDAVARLELDLADVDRLNGTLVSVDQLTGGFGEIDASAIGTGLALTVGVDYATDEVTAKVAPARTGQAPVTLAVHGSNAADVFHLGDADVATSVTAFDANDRIDLTRLLADAGAAAGDVTLKSIDAWHTDLMVRGGPTIAVTHAGNMGGLDLTVSGGRIAVVAGNPGAPRLDPDAPAKPDPEPDEILDLDDVPDDGNTAPIAYNRRYITDEDVVIEDSVKGRDPDREPIAFALKDAPEHGEVTITPDGRFSYTPDTDYNGGDSFTFVTSDGWLTDIGKISIRLIAQNDAPDAANDGGEGFRTDFRGAFRTGDVLANDSDVEGDRIRITQVDTSDTKGSVVQNRDGTFDYDPNGAFDRLQTGESATDTFSYTVTDGRGGTDTATVTISIGGQTVTRELLGTENRDLLLGTGGEDVIRSLGGHFDRMVGGGSADAFIFGAETRNGTGERDIIEDYQSDLDVIALVNGAEVNELLERHDRVIVVFEGDGDRLHVFGDDLQASDLAFVDNDAAASYIF